MKKNKPYLLFLLLCLFFQIYSQKKLNFLIGPLPFLNGVPVVSSDYSYIMLMLLWYFPIAALLFMFSGYLKKSSVSHGILIITRSQVKTSYLYKLYFKTFLAIFIFVLAQTFIAIIFIKDISFIYNTKLFITLLSYFLLLVFIIATLYLIELYINHDMLALLFSNMCLISSLIFPKIIKYLEIPNYFQYYVFTNYGMLYKSLEHSEISFYSLIINPFYGLIIITLFNIFIYILIAKKFKEIEFL
ncbi:DUF2705 domain-containing protein [Sutcliffiella horikoshii]|uniref:DUF2705 domain-containing protein n=1 Tax=Sutcliffiella horikoshii TaxID=79883 RepID=A0A5D4SZG5_9BACI|nr:DUF2705 domain-containing protein [Sutcliffiella horikoshii]